MKFFQYFRSNLFLCLFCSILIASSNSGKAQTLEHSFDIALENIVNAESFSDSIKKRTEYWSSINFNHKFFIVDSTEFNRNQVLTLNTNYHKYKDHTMSLKFYPKNDLNIKYEPSLVNEQLLYDDRGYLIQMESAHNFRNKVGKVFSMRKKNGSSL